MSKRIVILGGGVIGLTSAWYCLQRGHHVTLIERQPESRDGCSFGNAGMIVPSHVVPLASPGMIRMGMKWMWNRESPFSIHPRASWELLSWLWKFKNACSHTHVTRSAPLLRDLHQASRDCFEELLSELPQEVGFTRNGMLMLCRSEHALQEETQTAKLAASLNIEANVLDAEATSRLDPSIEVDVRGSVYYPGDCHLSPNRLMAALQSELEKRGCDFEWDTEWNGFQTEGETVRRVETTRGEFDADEVVVCGGVWSPQIARQLKVSIPMQAGKGYSLTLEAPCQTPSFCCILTEARVAVTPIGSALRFAGTMEIAGLDDSISASRVRGIVRSIPQYFPRFQASDFDDCQPWAGLRPCTPDGLPYIGRPKRWKNVILSTGHAMMGVSLAAISGSLVAQMASDDKPAIPRLELLSPDRYSERGTIPATTSSFTSTL